MEKEFFNQNPNATQVLKVGEHLFLVGFPAEAAKFAKKHDLTVEVIDRPAKVKVTKSEEAITNGTT
jgi:hypothetical protein